MEVSSPGAQGSGGNPVSSSGRSPCSGLSQESCSPHVPAVTRVTRSLHKGIVLGLCGKVLVAGGCGGGLL